MTDLPRKMRDDADDIEKSDSNWWLNDTVNYLRDGAAEIERLRAVLEMIANGYSADVDARPQAYGMMLTARQALKGEPK